MKLKVCGMKFQENIKGLISLQPDYLGLIFYLRSPRYAQVDLLETNSILNLPKGIKKVGVFVNGDPAEIRMLNSSLGFDYLQLHGYESPEYCKILKEQGFKLIKAFSLDRDFDFNLLDPYKRLVDFFLFDTKGPDHGGNGIPFDWNVLHRYDQEVPFFLSGGIDKKQLPELGSLKDLNLHALDINSRFELEPGLKDLDKISLFKTELDKLNELA